MISSFPFSDFHRYKICSHKEQRSPQLRSHSCVSIQSRTPTALAERQFGQAADLKTYLPRGAALETGVESSVYLVLWSLGQREGAAVGRGESSFNMVSSGFSLIRFSERMCMI